MENVLNSFVVPATNPSDLAGTATNRFQNGQKATVASMRTGAGLGAYTLQAAVSVSPDNFFVIPTFDDPLRQWVYDAIEEQGTINVMSAELDLTKNQTIVLVPPVTYKFIGGLLGLTWNVTQMDGTVTTGPTAQSGSDAAFTNIAPSTLQAALTAAVVNHGVGFVGLIANVENRDLSANGIVVQITSPAVLGTATVFKAKLAIEIQIYR
jgi:hypothetical protein